MGATKQQAIELSDIFYSSLASEYERYNTVIDSRIKALSHFMPMCNGDKEKEKFTRMYVQLSREKLLDFTIYEQTENMFSDIDAETIRWEREKSIEILKYRLRQDKWL